MRESVPSPSIVASEIEGSGLHHGAANCPPGRKMLIAAAHDRWKRKCADHLAHAAHLSKRAAKYFLSGGPSDACTRAIVREEMD